MFTTGLNSVWPQNQHRCATVGGTSTYFGSYDSPARLRDRELSVFDRGKGPWMGGGVATSRDELRIGYSRSNAAVTVKLAQGPTS